MTESILSLPLEIQIALGGGYLAHSVAYAGLRKQTGATELALRSLAFGIGALLIYRAALGLALPVAPAAVAAVLGAVLLGAMWRRWGMKWSGRLLSGLSKSREDGVPDAWSALIQAPDLNITQLSVRTTDGRILFHDRSAYGEALHDGLYLGNDGSIVMVVAEERMADGTERTAEDVTVRDWGTRITYLPAESIAQVNLRTPTLS